MPKKECLYYHIGECLGYCINKIDDDVVKQMVDEITRFLKGDDKVILDKLDKEMNLCIDLLSISDKLIVASDLSKGVCREIDFANLVGMEVEYLEKN